MQKQVEIGKSTYRFVNLVVLILSALCDSMVVQALSTINIEVTTYLNNVTTTMVSLCALQFMLIHPFVGLIANYILDHHGLKIGISVNAIFVILGVCLRMLGSINFAFIFIGNALNAMGNIFIINCPARFSALWFKPSHRLIVTSLIVFSNAISGGIGAIMSPWFVPSGLTPQEGKNKLQFYTIIQGSIISFIMLINIIFFRGNDTSIRKIQSSLSKSILSVQQRQQNGLNSSQYQSIKSPQNKIQQIVQASISQSSDIQQNQFNQRQTTLQNLTYLQSLKYLLTNPNYLKILFTNMCILAVLNSFATNVQLYIAPFGFTSRDSAIATFLALISGLFGCIFSSIIVKKTRLYKRTIMYEQLISVGIGFALCGALWLQNYLLLYIVVIFFGIFLYPILPGTIEYACECMYPIRQATVMGLLVGSGQLASFIIGLIQSTVLSSKSQSSSFIALSINTALFLIGFAIFSTTKEQLRRLNTNI